MYGVCLCLSWINILFGSWFEILFCTSVIDWLFFSAFADIYVLVELVGLSVCYVQPALSVGFVSAHGIVGRIIKVHYNLLVVIMLIIRFISSKKGNSHQRPSWWWWWCVFVCVCVCVCAAMSPKVVIRSSQNVEYRSSWWNAMGNGESEHGHRSQW